MNRNITLAAIGGLLAITGSASSLAQTHRYHHYYHDRAAYNRKCGSGNGAVGTVAGGVGGALIGNAVGGGTLGTLGGGIGGALLGRTIDKNNTRHRNERNNGC